jgi:hypothetical protein
MPTQAVRHRGRGGIFRGSKARVMQNRCHVNQQRCGTRDIAGEFLFTDDSLPPVLTVKHLNLWCPPQHTLWTHAAARRRRIGDRALGFCANKLSWSFSDLFGDLTVR